MLEIDFDLMWPASSAIQYTVQPEKVLEYHFRLQDPVRQIESVVDDRSVKSPCPHAWVQTSPHAPSRKTGCQQEC